MTRKNRTRPTPAFKAKVSLAAIKGDVTVAEQYPKTPFYGSRKMAAWLREQGYAVGRDRVRCLMRLLGLEAIYQKPRTSKPAAGHKVSPYLLRDLVIDRPNQVWCSDVTYVPMAKSFLYLVAVRDWFSRYVLSWRLSTSLHADFCVDALEEALDCYGKPGIFNTDQGAQFTSEAFTTVLLDAKVTISMDGKGRCMDNVFIERRLRAHARSDTVCRRLMTDRTREAFDGSASSPLFAA